MKNSLIITAHSGCDNTPDNSMEFVEYALSIGVDAFEIDVRNFNNTLIISHDEPKDSENLVYLCDVFKLANSKPSVGINCDLKDKNIEQLVLNLAEECKLQNKIMFSGWVSLEKTKEIQEKNLTESSLLENSPEVYLNIDCLFDDYYEDRVKLAIDKGEKVSFTQEECEEILASMLECKAKTLNIHYSCCDKNLMELLAKQDIYLSCWTATTEEEVRMLMNDGLRNITTQIPALALKIRDEILGQQIKENI